MNKLFINLTIISISLILILCDPQIPDIFSIVDNFGNKIVGYKIVWEIDIHSSDTNQKIVSVTEYYDIKSGAGRLEYVSDGQNSNGTYIYFGNTTGETFHITQNSCNSSDISKVPAFLQNIMNYYNTQLYGFMIDKNISGPSAYIRIISKNPVTFSGQQINQFDKRYYNTSKWTALHDFAYPVYITWLFTDQKSPNPFGFNNFVIPVWINITYNAGVKSRRDFQIAKFIPYFESSPEYYDFKNLFKVPIGYGCQRDPKAVVNAPKHPVLDAIAFSFDMKLEVVMNPTQKWVGNDSMPTNLVDNGRLVYDHISQMYSWSYDGFNVTGNVQNSYYDDNQAIDSQPLKDNNLANPTRTVWDLRSNLVYIIDDINGGCTLKFKENQDFLVSINFKRGYKISINTSELIHGKDFVYMGESIERGIPCYVYEKVTEIIMGFGKERVARNVIFTHYIDRNNYYEDLVTDNMFIRIGISVVEPTKVLGSNNLLHQVWSAVINVNDFTVRVPINNIWSHIKQKVFDIRNCYLSKELSKWFQIKFPVTSNQYNKLKGESNTIDRQILYHLFTDSDLLIPPTRIPKSVIGWKNNTILFNALMIERQPFIFDFKLLSNNSTLKKVNKQFLVDSPQNCYQRCLDLNENCIYLSLCDNVMCLLGDPSLSYNTKPETNSSKNCITYEKIQNNYNSFTMNYFLDKLKNKTTGSSNKKPTNPLSFTLYIINSTGLPEDFQITGTEFKSSSPVEQNPIIDSNISKSDSSRYSSSAGAGIGVFMILLGSFLAVVAIIIYERRKNN